MNKVSLLLIILTLAFWPAQEAFCQDQPWTEKIKQILNDGAVLVTDPTGKPILSINADKAMVPASTLKLVVAAAALDFLGPQYRFTTEFHLSGNQDLYVIGRGDPYLISEELAIIAKRLKTQGLTRVKDIRLDNSFFLPGLVLDGTEKSLHPYDAYNGALCVNFNTIYLYLSPKGLISSAERQTPLTDLGKQLAAKTKTRGKVRFNLAENPDICLQYAGELLKAFLVKAGVEVKGRILPAEKDPGPIQLFYRHQSRQDLREMVAQLLKHSNNFMTNQIFLTLGAEKYGAPADEIKARRAVADYLTTKGIPTFHLEEGSGLSRRTKVSAGQLEAILREFKPYRGLLTSRGRTFFKTGTLKDVKSMAGYLVPTQGEPLNFVILMNGVQVSYTARDKILGLLEENLL
ncbi:MAG: D-alanyl-D-alanine carboxypeptidase [Thermodesulfobacteriota bacterium]